MWQAVVVDPCSVPPWCLLPERFSIHDKTELFCASKDAFNSVKSHPTEWETFGAVFIKCVKDANCEKNHAWTSQAFRTKTSLCFHSIFSDLSETHSYL